MILPALSPSGFLKAQPADLILGWPFLAASTFAISALTRLGLEGVSLRCARVTTAPLGKQLLR
jgi:hypothetical protein